MWRRCITIFAMAIFGCSILSFGGGISVPENVVEASSQPVPRLAEREMKKNKDYEASDLYARAHHLIYGSKAPVGPGGRTRIAIVINGEEILVAEDRVKNVVYQAVRDKFPREYFAVMKGTDVNTKLLQKAEREYAARLDADPRGVQQNRPDADGMKVPNRPRGLADMLLDDYVEAGKACNYDYLLVLTFSEGQQDAYIHDYVLWRNRTNKQNVWMRLRFVDVANRTYLYRNDMAAMGKGHNGFFNGKMLERSVTVLMNEAMDDIDVSED